MQILVQASVYSGCCFFQVSVDIHSKPAFQQSTTPSDPFAQTEKAHMSQAKVKPAASKKQTFTHAATAPDAETTPIKSRITLKLIQALQTDAICKCQA